MYGGIIRIDNLKGVQEGQTSISPQNPKSNIAASPTISRKGVAVLGMAGIAAKQTYSTAVSEIRAGGNESLATDIENGVLLAGTVLMAIGTGGWSLVPQGISVGATIVTRSRRIARENRRTEYERAMLGSRQSYGIGGAYE
jgi:hypothetical protein